MMPQADRIRAGGTIKYVPVDINRPLSFTILAGKRAKVEDRHERPHPT
jgi:hypothetical protein